MCGLCCPYDPPSPSRNVFVSSNTQPKACGPFRRGPPYEGGLSLNPYCSSHWQARNWLQPDTGFFESERGGKTEMNEQAQSSRVPPSGQPPQALLAWPAAVIQRQEASQCWGMLGVPPPGFILAPQQRGPLPNLSACSLWIRRGGYFCKCVPRCLPRVRGTSMYTSKVCIPSGAYPTRIHYSGFSLPHGERIRRNASHPKKVASSVGEGRWEREGECACVQTHTPPHTHSRPCRAGNETPLPGTCFPPQRVCLEVIV